MTNRQMLMGQVYCRIINGTNLLNNLLRASTQISICFHLPYQRIGDAVPLFIILQALILIFRCWCRPIVSLSTNGCRSPVAPVPRQVHELLSQDRLESSRGPLPVYRDENRGGLGGFRHRLEGEVNDTTVKGSTGDSRGQLPLN